MEEWVNNEYEKGKDGMDLGEYKGDDHDKEEGDPPKEDTKKLDDKEIEGEEHWDSEEYCEEEGDDGLKGRDDLNARSKLVGCWEKMMMCWQR